MSSCPSRFLGSSHNLRLTSTNLKSAISSTSQFRCSSTIGSSHDDVASTSQKDSDISSRSRNPDISLESDETRSIDTTTRHKARSYGIPKNILSGIQPTGIPHLGNYLGALRKWKELQDEKAESDRRKRRNHRLLFSIVDLHSLTLAQDPQVRRKLILESYASLLAIGLDSKLSHVFIQSHIPAHSELMWILSTIASTGYLSRMTQWKTKLGFDDQASLTDSETKDKLKLGLFSYPVLQAADILLYQTDLVPVGEDQVQHIEFTRNLARSFNAHYMNQDEPPVFRLPNVLVSPASRVMSLKEPTKKMSKSHTDPNSRILITDTEEEIRRKIKGATTDSITGISYDPQQRPGVSNLIDILKNITKSEQSSEEIAKEHENLGLGALKSLVADEIIKGLAGVRDRYHSVISTPLMEESISRGAQGAKSVANKTLNSAYKALGIIRR